MKTKLLLVSLILASGLSFAQNPFPVLNENFYDSIAHPTDPLEVIVPASPIKYDALFVGGVDYVHNAGGDSALAKEWHDFTGFIPNNGRSDLGYVIVNHERVQRDSINGDGGGMTVFEVKYDTLTDAWQVIPDSTTGKKFKNVDFSNVGGTGANCGGIQTSWGKVFTAEEWGGAFRSNAGISAQGISDTSDYTVTSFNGSAISRIIKRVENFQYMVEVDPKNAVAVRKNYNMGRYDHEGGWIASDRRTAYLTDDASSGSVLFRFVADVAEDFSKGQLAFYKQSEDGATGQWVDIPMTFDNMLNARDVALADGATIFMRLEWIEGINDDIVFITETGRGRTVSVAGAVDKGGKLANHLVELDAADGELDTTFNDIYGRILRLNTATGNVEVALEGGGNLNTKYDATDNHLSSPDGLVSTVIDGRTYLAINEDMNPSGKPTNPGHFAGRLNEIYLLDVTGDTAGVTYSVDDLTRFVAGPAGCETTGGRFTPDGSTYFVNIQHPSTSNTPPFNHSVTIAITGYKDIITNLKSYKTPPQPGFGLYPNPATREVYLSKKMDVAVYTLEGKRVFVQRNTDKLDISNLSSGAYIVRNDEGESKKLIIE